MYTSMNPLIVSTGASVSSTQAMSYATRSSVSPDLVERDEGVERFLRRLGARPPRRPPGARRSSADLLRIPPTDPVGLLDELAVALRPAGSSSGYCSSNPSRSLHRHADVEVVGAGLARMSLPGPGVLFVTIGSKSGSKNIGRSRSSSAVERLARPRSGNRPRPRSRPRPRRPAPPGCTSSTNFRAVRWLYGPVLSQNSLV